MKFLDSKGNEIVEGDEIVITGHYNYQFLIGQKAKIIWDTARGMYNFTYTEVRRGKTFTSTDDFYGVHSFEKI